MHGINGYVARSGRTAALLELACHLDSLEFAKRPPHLLALRQVLFLEVSHAPSSSRCRSRQTTIRLATVSPETQWPQLTRTALVRPVDHAR
jgi:hypothetical protein